MSPRFTPAVCQVPGRPTLDRRFSHDTVIEDEPQETQFFVPMQRHHSRLSTIPDESPTSDEDQMVFKSPLLQEKQSQLPDEPATFHDLYDMTDDEAEAIPVRISAPSTRTPTQAVHIGKRFPSLVIPSPSTWPTIHNTRKGNSSRMLSSDMLSPNLLSPTPHALSALVSGQSDDTSSREPSLDGSWTSEELSNLSCPSTPDMNRHTEEAAWSAPVQLHPRALQTLDCLTGRSRTENSPSHPVVEMREVDEQRPQLGLRVSTPEVEQDSAEFSALSVPSPGGFFSDHEPCTRYGWLPTPIEQPSTCVAERFYAVPWVDAGQHSERILEIDFADNRTEGPLTARRDPIISPRAAIQDTGHRRLGVKMNEGLSDHTEYKEHYQDQLLEVSSANLGRTSIWLQSQLVHPEKVGCDFSASLASAHLPPLPPEKKVVLPSIDTGQLGSSATSVQFNSGSPAKENSSTLGSPKEASFVQSFEHMKRTGRGSDAFVHRKTRADALRLDRKCLFTSHVNRLEGRYTLQEDGIVGTIRPVSDFFTGETPEQSDVVAIATRERKALEQVKPISWNLEATKMLNGGTLLTSPTGKFFPKIPDGRVLDLGGQASCDWAWQVAIEHPSATVHTVFMKDQIVDSRIESPSNHRQQCVPNLWTLPYPSNHFHIVSARGLYSILKTDRPRGQTRDEYDLCLRECMRILKPGGYLEFALLDADIMGAGRQGSALSVEFCFNLKTRGYDSNPTKLWLPRLRRAGFNQVRRAWLTLPLTQSSEKGGTTADVSHISGLVGSWAWERWMLKLHKEMGKEADRLLEGVPAALDEGAETGASWRYLSGWARKPL